MRGSAQGASAHCSQLHPCRLTLLEQNRAGMPRHRNKQLHHTIYTGIHLPQLEQLIPAFSDMGLMKMPGSDASGCGALLLAHKFDLVDLVQVPSKEQAASVTEELRARSALPDYLKKTLASLPKDTHPMTQLSIAILALQVTPTPQLCPLPAFFLCLSVCTCVCLSVPVSVCLSVCACLSVCPSACLSVYIHWS